MDPEFLKNSELEIKISELEIKNSELEKTIATKFQISNAMHIYKQNLIQ